MKLKHDLTDIGNAINKALDNPFMTMIRTGVIGTLENSNPVAGVIAGIGDSFLSEYNTFKFSLLLKGLATGLNMETRLNELYNYVSSSQEKAINVANLFRKTINSECPKVCVIYGLILAKHTENNSQFTQDELLVCKALENATENDLKNFKEIMEKYLKTRANENRIVFPKDFVGLDEYTTTCDWGVYNRIFISRMNEWQEIEDDNLDGVLDMSTHYYGTKSALVLMEYINDAHQIWDY